MAVTFLLLILAALVGSIAITRQEKWGLELRTVALWLVTFALGAGAIVVSIHP